MRALDLREHVERLIWSALESVTEDARLQPRMTNALWDAFFERTVTPAYYIPLADVSRATATNDLGNAVAAGLLEPRSGGRSRRYVASRELFRRIGDALGIDVPEAGARAHIVAALGHELAQGR